MTPGSPVCDWEFPEGKPRAGAEGTPPPPQTGSVTGTWPEALTAAPEGTPRELRKWGADLGP